VAIHQLILFSTDTGDVWLLDVTDHLAVRLAREGTRTRLPGKDRRQFRDRMARPYRIEGAAFIYVDRDTRRITTILGYPTQKISQAG
jgi:hypothetical protein